MKPYRWSFRWTFQEKSTTFPKVSNDWFTTKFTNAQIPYEKGKDNNVKEIVNNPQYDPHDDYASLKMIEQALKYIMGIDEAGEACRERLKVG